MWCWFGIEAISVNFWFSVYIHRYRNACKCRGVCACSTHIHQFFSLKVSGSNTPIAMGTLSPHILSSNDHSPLEKFKALWEMANSRFRQGNYKMNLDHHLKENAQNILGHDSQVKRILTSYIQEIWELNKQSQWWLISLE